MALRSFTKTVTTDGSGDATDYIGPFSGYIQTIQYIRDATTNYTDGVDFTITVEGTGETVWTQADVNATVTKAPRQATHSTAGVAALYASGGVAVNDRVALSRDRLKIVLAQGGASKVGKFIVIVDG